MYRFALFLPAFLLVLNGCGTTPQYAPVQDRGQAGKSSGAKSASRSREGDWRPQTHTVQKGDTLYAIALEYGYDYKELAELNGISTPYVIRIGQQLRVNPQPQTQAMVQQEGGVVTSALKPVATQAESRESSLKTQPKAVKISYSVEAENAPAVAVAHKPELVAVKPPPAEEKPKPSEVKAAPASSEGTKAGTDDEDLDWAWPSKGKIIASFNESASLKGLDISGKAGQPVLASAPGKVVYSGSGLRGYGKLVIIKHNKTFLSAYAHNSQILVREGQTVTKGQRIAEMGDSDADQVKLHFEIRRMGKPVDPLKYLPEGSG
ncbi:MAG: peptidoglycan DD-metalloendopeptidase family protein [Pseudomonadota bacterium]|nr:peptidoglycan DD-metalloendopeptidase family protein [Gammaproteobacteria bacterium]MBU1731173.1 peptidoglycan DD-metalloendopeptidase family protein [Gammaproteobacteria bacterium]MBU1891484.1 peptidoglycan DD-metalloendopeptidase family protein [Gammaproteobacteria bacterium]